MNAIYERLCQRADLDNIAIPQESLKQLTLITAELHASSILLQETQEALDEALTDYVEEPCLEAQSTYATAAARNARAAAVREHLVEAARVWALHLVLEDEDEAVTVEFEERGWRLVSAANRHRKYPFTFGIPAEEERNQLTAGTLVKLVFQFLHSAGDEREITEERMWVRVTEQGENYAGTLTSEPQTTDLLRPGDLIVFSSDDVSDIAEP